jgi:hypothetical protein
VLPELANPRAPVLNVRQTPLGSTIRRPQSGAHADRRSRQDARAWRRYGDWSVLDVPTVLLWVDDDSNSNCDDDSCQNDY